MHFSCHLFSGFVLSASLQCLLPQQLGICTIYGLRHPSTPRLAPLHLPSSPPSTPFRTQSRSLHLPSSPPSTSITPITFTPIPYHIDPVAHPSRITHPSHPSRNNHHLDSSFKYTDLFEPNCGPFGDFTDIKMIGNGYVVPKDMREYNFPARNFDGTFYEQVY